MKKIEVTRYHDISCGHRVHGHESKCADFHGHNYRIHFTLNALYELDNIGRVIDFGIIKSVLCEWLEENWDHKFLMWQDDPNWPHVGDLPGFIQVPFNPTAENMALYLCREIGPSLLAEHGVKLTRVKIDETRKCSAEVSF